MLGHTNDGRVVPGELRGERLLQRRWLRGCACARVRLSSQLLLPEPDPGGFAQAPSHVTRAHGAGGGAGEGQELGQLFPPFPLESPSQAHPANQAHPGTDYPSICVSSSSDKRVPVPVDSTLVRSSEAPQTSSRLK